MKLLSKVPFSVFLGCAASAAMASSVSVHNATPIDMTVIYKIAHKNQGQPTQLGETQTLHLKGNATAFMPISLDGYTYAGIVPISVNEHVIPNNANHFTQPQQCTAAIDATHSNVKMTFTAHMEKPKSLSCTVDNSVAE